MGEYEKQGYLYDDFKMFHLKDNQERGFSYHYHDFYKIIFFLKGSVHYHIEGRSYDLNPYDVVLVGKGMIHKPEVSFEEPYERIIFYISQDYLDKNREEGYNPGFCFEKAAEENCHVVGFPALQNTRFLELIGEISENGREERYGSAQYAALLFAQLLLLLNRSCTEGSCNFHQRASYNSKIIQIVSYINQHLKEPLPMEELAKQCFISKFYMMRTFKEETGYTVHQYITEKRILMAKQLIDQGMSATNACYESGFRDYSTFLRAYKQRMEKSPREK